MELDEAIVHAREEAQMLKKKVEGYSDKPYDFNSAVKKNCLKCAEEHEQLAEWLEQLLAIQYLYKEYEGSGGGFHYQVGSVFDGDYVLPKTESEDKRDEM